MEVKLRLNLSLRILFYLKTSWQIIFPTFELTNERGFKSPVLINLASIKEMMSLPLKWFHNFVQKRREFIPTINLFLIPTNLILHRPTLLRLNCTGANGFCGASPGGAKCL